VVGWGRIFLAGLLLLVATIASVTGLGYLINHVILGRELWLVIDLLLGLVFGLPLFIFLFVMLVKRWRRPRILERRRGILE
jgi:hypothetical protein